MLSEAPTRVNILSTMPIFAASAGTKHPICAISTIRAVCRSSADLPAMFGPVIIMICCDSFPRVTLLAMYDSPGGSCFSITGCRPSTMSMSSDSLTSGRLYRFSIETLVNDIRQSSRATSDAFNWIAGMYVATAATRSLNSRVSSERIFSSAPRIFSSYSFSS